MGSARSAGLNEETHILHVDHVDGDSILLRSDDRQQPLLGRELHSAKSGLVPSPRDAAIRPAHQRNAVVVESDDVALVVARHVWHDDQVAGWE